MVIGLIVFLFQFVVAPFAIVHALLFKRDHRAALGWISVSILFPIIGPLLYFLFGVNRIQRRAREVIAGERLSYFGHERGEMGLLQAAPSQMEGYQHPLALVGWHTTASPLIGGNRVTFLENGDAFYPALIEAIKSARRRVWISSYIFSGHGVGLDITTALVNARKRGVDTRVLVDGIGAWYSLHSLRKQLQGAGVCYAEFLPPRLLPPSLRINLRNHRKIAIVDGNQAFFGGLNIDDRHFVTSPRISRPHVDVHFDLRGPIVVNLAEIFARDWYAATREVLIADGDSDGEQGSVRARVIEDGPDESLDRLAMTLMGLVGAARQRIRIMTPYFLPHRELMGALQGAAVRGIVVEILLPQRSNLRYVDWAARHALWELLQWGVRIGLKPPPFAHSKLFIVDSDYVLGGSANLDPRSLRLNFEVGVELFDTALAATINEYLDRSWRGAQMVGLEDVDQRSLQVRLRDGFFWLFSAYL